MKRIIVNYRYWVLIIIALIAFIGTFAVPGDDLPRLTWTAVLILSKVIGVGAFYLVAVLADRWENEGSIPEATELKELTKKL